MNKSMIPVLIFFVMLCVCNLDLSLSLEISTSPSPHLRSQDLSLRFFHFADAKAVHNQWHSLEFTLCL
jgi:hypothetical protein